MAFFKKYRLFFLGLGIIFVYFFTRLYNILELPIFTDEAIYVRWSQIASNDASWRFISLTDGKQPMFVWIAMVLMKVIQDPLLAGRVVSVGAGFLSVIGLFFLTSEIFKNPSTTLRASKIGLLASFVYVLYPFALIYDKIALYDSLVVLFIIWAFYFEVLLVRRLRLDLAMILGIIMGLGMLTKTSNNFAFILLPFSLLLFNFKDKNWKMNLRNWIIYAFVSLLIANSMYLVLRLSPYFHVIGEKNLTFIYSFKEIFQDPYSQLFGNLKGLLAWLIEYTTIPFFVLVLSSFIIRKEYFKEKLLLLVWFLAPFAGLALFGKVIYPRFIFFMTMPLLVLGAYAFYYLLSFVKKTYIKILVVCVFFGIFFVNDFFIFTNFEKAFIPQSDKSQFIASWPSGVGVRETIEFLEEKSKNEKIYVGTEGTFGLMPYSLEIYFHDNPNIKTVGFWPINDIPPKEVLESAKKMPTYFVFYQPCPPCGDIGVAPVTWPLKQIFQIKKIEKDSFYTLYQVIPQ